MNIRAITATSFRIPLRSPMALSTGTRASVEHVLVEVETDDGVTGYGECVPRPSLYGETVATAPQVIAQTLMPRVAGLAVSDVQRIHCALGGIAGNPTAKAAIELAAFDAYGKTIGEPAHRLLGGHADDVPCCAMLGYGQPSAVLDEAVAAIGQYGIGTLKFKVGTDVGVDVEVAARLRAGLGDEVELYPDGNSLYSFTEAATFVDRTRELRLRWIEEPMSASDVAGRQHLVAMAAYPVIGDESCQDSVAAARELRAGRSTGVSIKAARTAIVESTRIRELCASLGAPALLGSQGDSAIGAVASIAIAAASPVTSGHAAEVMFCLGLEGNLVAPPLVVDGRTSVCARPGFGYELDHDALNRYQTRP